jgi:hypothetical protein
MLHDTVFIRILNFFHHTEFRICISHIICILHVSRTVNMSSPFGMFLGFFCHMTLSLVLAFHLSVFRVDSALDAKDLKDFGPINELSPSLSSDLTLSICSTLTQT